MQRPPATAAAPSTEAHKQRILSHMNADHSHHLALYARHYASLPAPFAASAKATDITLTAITLSFPGQAHSGAVIVVPLSRPMASFSEAREVLRDMVFDCYAGLGLSPHKVERYIPPTSALDLLVIVGAVLGTVSFWSPDRFLGPGGFSREYVLMGYAPLAELFRTYATWWLFGVVGIHAAEMLLLMKPRLRRHQVDAWRLWAAWMGSAFLEGHRAARRFDAEVKRVEEKTAH